MLVTDNFNEVELEVIVYIRSVVWLYSQLVPKVNSYQVNSYPRSTRTQVKSYPRSTRTQMQKKRKVML